MVLKGGIESYKAPFYEGVVTVYSILFLFKMKNTGKVEYRLT